MRVKDWCLFGLVLALLAVLVTVPVVAQDGVTNLTGLHLAVPTYQATATPGLLINNLSVGNAVEIQDGGTDFFRFEADGNVVHTVPTALATSVSGMVINNKSVAPAVEIQAASTPEYYFNSSKLDLLGNYLEADIGTEHIMFPCVVSKAITYTAAAGGTGAVATIADGEIWFVHDVFVRTTTNFDATGDDATLVVGDGNDADGFVVLADADLQAAATEQTGSAAGWFGLLAANKGVYLDGSGGPLTFIYAPSGAAETIDYLIDESSGETLSAGAATIYVVYTRIL